MTRPKPNADDHITENRGGYLMAILNTARGENAVRVRVLGRVRTLKATWDADADEGRGAMNVNELRLVSVLVDGERHPRSICADRFVGNVRAHATVAGPCATPSPSCSSSAAPSPARSTLRAVAPASARPGTAASLELQPSPLPARPRARAGLTPNATSRAHGSVAEGPATASPPSSSATFDATAMPIARARCGAAGPEPTASGDAAEVAS